MGQKFEQILDFMVKQQAQALKKNISFNEQLADELSKGAGKISEAYIETLVLSHELQNMAMQKGIDFNMEAFLKSSEDLKKAEDLKNAEKKQTSQKKPSGFKP
jgi:hypothetical protein